MITTVTGTTLADASLVVIAIVTLVIFLIQKEIVSGLASPRAARLSGALNVALVPLFVVFVATLVVRLFGVLR